MGMPWALPRRRNSGGSCDFGSSSSTGRSGAPIAQEPVPHGGTASPRRSLLGDTSDGAMWAFYLSGMPSGIGFGVSNGRGGSTDTSGRNSCSGRGKNSTGRGLGPRRVGVECSTVRAVSVLGSSGRQAGAGPGRSTHWYSDCAADVRVEDMPGTGTEPLGGKAR